MNETKLSEALHELTSLSQMFHSYEQLCENLSFRIQPKKIQEICRKGALRLREIRQVVLETYTTETNLGKEHE